MPAKAIPIIVAAVVATGIVIYNNREQIVELYERGRNKLAQSLHKIADQVGARQREGPMGYSDLDEAYRRRSFDDRLRREEEAEGFLQPYGKISNPEGRTTGRAQNAPARYRQRNTGGECHVLYDLPAVKEDLPPLPPRRTLESAPSESGYGSEQTAFISSPLRPARVQQQSSPLAQQSEVIMPSAPPAEPAPRALSPPAPALPVSAAVVVAGAAVGATVAAALTPEALTSLPTSLPTSPSTLPDAQSPPSTHSSSSHSEPDVIPPNPFESAASYMSTQEWINNTSCGSSEDGDSRPPTQAGQGSDDGSVVGAGEIVDIPEVVSEFGSGSDGEFDDAASWTELGSETSENDY
ncbi:hypothetical protein L211DRAFT_250453 [Terfezia boudieri ATCC MYA-4762]|uniref:Uncharacterized protein n=1 Tax=Terfezia boudieri ATCC MYA-4762 TaxID=1051890 RepID=A0A3N4M549_9PEZI|nr:hypothetical protein L211DRAFT_250453 [Terfezia boudieri ATCC MYA-4762]